MRILILHNRYRQFGGEDQVVRSEVDLLRSRGVEVREYTVDNDIHTQHAVWETVRLAWNSAWCQRSHDDVLAACREFRPDVAHVHNFWLSLSPSVHAACHAAGVPTVQTLHNFRLFCANGLFKRGNSTCEACLGRIPWRGVAYRCYRDSFLASVAVARMIVVNRRRETWEADVDAFVALSDHSRSLFIEGGLPPERVFVKANFAEDPGPSHSAPSASNVVLFAGRLAPEKGVNVLLDAWARAGLHDRAKLVIAGDGPDRSALEVQAVGLGLAEPSLVFAGQRPAEEVRKLMRGSRVVVLPSLFFECFPRVLVEAFACGRPVVGSEIGALNEIVPDKAGILFPARDAGALAEALRLFVLHPDLADAKGAAARDEYLSRYTPDRNFSVLMNIYKYAMCRKEECAMESAR